MNNAHRIHHIRSSTPYMVEVSQPHVPTCGPCRVGYKKMIKTKARQGNESHNCVSLIFKGLDSLWCRCCKWDPPPDVLYFCILCHKAMYDTQQRECQTPYKCSVQPYNWLMHTSDTCTVCGRCPICISPKVFVGLQAFSYTFIQLDDSTSLRQKVTPPKQ